MIPYGRQNIDDDDIAAVTATLRSNMLTGGPAVDRFEDALHLAVNAPYAVSCANGTAALHMAAMALNLGPGDAVVVPSVTFLASANMARYVGADVRFADVDPDTGLLTPESFVRALATDGPGQPKAVVPVHLNGQCVDMQGVYDVAQKHGLDIVEDACHALGGYCEFEGKLEPVGAASHSSMVCFSFHAVKTVAMGEGGAITTRNADFDVRLRILRNHGMSRDKTGFVQCDEAYDDNQEINPWYYEMESPGFNYRASDIHCALGVSQIAKLSKFIERRRELAVLYDQLLKSFVPLLRPVQRSFPERDGWHLYPVLIDFAQAGLSRAQVMTQLRDRGVGTQVHYLPVHRQPYYRELYPGVELPGANAYYEKCLSLPLFVGLLDEQVEEIVETLGDILGLQ
jgi:UDP-4-amino-4,6-dideoxy-N-acetyl-beta-L-altrosamine transaminase